MSWCWSQKSLKTMKTLSDDSSCACDSWTAFDGASTHAWPSRETETWNGNLSGIGILTSCPSSWRPCEMGAQFRWSKTLSLIWTSPGVPSEHLLVARLEEVVVDHEEKQRSQLQAPFRYLAQKQGRM